MVCNGLLWGWQSVHLLSGFAGCETSFQADIGPVWAVAREHLGKQGSGSGGACPPWESVQNHRGCFPPAALPAEGRIELPPPAAGAGAAAGRSRQPLLTRAGSHGPGAAGRSRRLAVPPGWAARAWREPRAPACSPLPPPEENAALPRGRPQPCPAQPCGEDAKPRRSIKAPWAGREGTAAARRGEGGGTMAQAVWGYDSDNGERARGHRGAGMRPAEQGRRFFVCVPQDPSAGTKTTPWPRATSSPPLRSTARTCSTTPLSPPGTPAMTPGQRKPSWTTGAPAASSSTTLLIDQVGLYFLGVVRNQGLQSAGYQKASFSIQPVQASREKSLGKVKKVPREFILVDLKGDKTGC